MTDTDFDPGEIVRNCYGAYVTSDRSVVEALIADEFSFTSPYDNALTRETYFERCWPNHEFTEAFEFIHVHPVEDKVFVVYEVSGSHGNFRNCEMLTVKNGQITDIEVYFGWNTPHKAPKGGFVSP